MNSFVAAEQRKIIIWGTGKVAKEFYSKHKDSSFIEAFMDNDFSKKTCCGKPLYTYSEYCEKAEGSLIIIATMQWKDVSLQLHHLGLRVLKDFLPFFLWDANEIDYFALRETYSESECIDIIRFCKRKGRKAVILIANCQGDVIRPYLLQNSEFVSKYIFLNIPRIYYFFDGWMVERYEEKFWSECDLLISQQVKGENEFSSRVSSEVTASWLPPATKIIWIPNAYFDGYFPQMKDNAFNLDTDIGVNGRFPIGDRYIETFVLGGVDNHFRY